MPKKLIPDEQNPTIHDIEVVRHIIVHNLAVVGGYVVDGLFYVELKDTTGAVVAERTLALRSSISIDKRNEVQVRGVVDVLIRLAIRQALADFAGVIQ